MARRVLGPPHWVTYSGFLEWGERSGTQGGEARPHAAPSGCSPCGLQSDRGDAAGRHGCFVRGRVGLVVLRVTRERVLGHAHRSLVVGRSEASSRRTRQYQALGLGATGRSPAALVGVIAGRRGSDGGLRRERPPVLCWRRCALPLVSQELACRGRAITASSGTRTDRPRPGPRRCPGGRRSGRGERRGASP